MNISTEVNAIVKQAPEWNFAGDCAILALMKRISQNLHERGEATSQKLREFETNVKITDIALNNATNSLRSLQFGQQFVEYRIEEVDDDDFGTPEVKKKALPPEKSTDEMAKEFLQNNLNMFRKNFEPVTLEVPDSDDDEDEGGAKKHTTIYRPKNPYDCIPLPYIIGTKEWEEHKYAGLYDSKNNSEDEQSDEFSSSSSDEKEPSKSEDKRPDLQTESDSPPIAPLSKEAVIAVVKQAAPSPPISVPELAPRTQPRPIITSQRQQQPHEHDLFAALRQSPPSDDPPSTSSSLRSSPAFTHLPAAGRGTAAEPSLSSSASSAQQLPTPKLFEEETKPVAIDPPKEVTAKPSNPIKRMPVNLFNDDEFNSFMTEIVDKAKGKTTTEIQKKPLKEPRMKELVDEKPKMEIKAKSMNLFDDSPPMSPGLNQPTPKPTRSITVPVTTIKSLPKSLFEDDLEDDDDFLSSLTAKAKPKSVDPITKKTSLFDDDDLDIDDIFSKKPSTSIRVTENAKTKTALFEPETAPPSPPPPMVLLKKSLFDDIEDDDDLFGTPKTIKPLSISSMELPPEDEDEEEKMEPIEIVNPETVKPNIEKENKITLPDGQSKFSSSAAKPFKVTDLFNDDFSDDELEPVPKAISNEVEPMNNKEDDKMIKLVKDDGDGIFIKRYQDSLVSKDPFTDVNNFSNTLENESKTSDFDSKKDDLFQNLQMDPASAVVSDSDDESVQGDLFNKANVPASTVDVADQFKNPILRDSPPPDIFEEKGDPIVSMVAEVTNSRQTKDHATSYKPADLAAAQTIMQNYTSLFSDEPPDDSEFFQTLANSNLSSLSASKIFDNDQDFFEPALPKVPSGSKSSSTGIFSDVPPDDDNTDDNFTPKTSSVEIHGATTRIHTIFYDDFSETARAGSAVGAGSPNLPIAKEEVMPQKDETDRQAPVEPISPVKKLKMPNININVQALMPGSGAKLIKKTDLLSGTQEKSVEKVTDFGNSENILQHVNKTRVRGPPQRRPSTRRGRKENYEKTLLEEEPHQAEKFEEEPIAPVNPKSTFFDSEDDIDDSLFTPVQPAPQQITKEPSKEIVQSQKKVAPFLKSYSKLFDDSEDDEDLFASAVPALSTTVPVSTRTTATAKVLPNPKVVPVKITKSLFSDDEDDDDLFGIKSTKVQAKPISRNVVKPDVSAAIPPSSSKLSKTIPLGTDNPLSDLLGSE